MSSNVSQSQAHRYGHQQRQGIVSEKKPTMPVYMKCVLLYLSMYLCPCFVNAMNTLLLAVCWVFLAFAGTSLSSPLSTNVLTRPSFNQSDLSTLNASAFNLSEGTFNRYPVSGTPVTLDVYSYEAQAIPQGRLYATLSAAAVLIQTVVEKYPNREITSGLWQYEHRSRDGFSCTFRVNDFREDGKPLIYSRLLDILRGLISFSYDKDIYTTYYYLADIKDVGVSASGRIDYARSLTTTATVDVT